MSDWIKKDITKTINSWYFTKLQWQELQDKLSEAELKELMTILDDVQELRFKMNLILNKNKQEVK